MATEKSKKTISREKMLQKVLKDGSALEKASKEQQADREIVLAAVSNHGPALEYAAPELKADREIVMAAVGDRGFAFEFAAAELRATREIALAAVSNYGDALQHVPMELQADREIVLAAVSVSPQSLQYADPALRADKEVVLTAVQGEAYALTFAAEQIRLDRDILLAALGQDPMVVVDILGTSFPMDDDLLDKIFGYQGLGSFPDAADVSDGMKEFIALLNADVSVNTMNPGDHKYVGDAGVPVRCLHVIENQDGDGASCRIKFYVVTFSACPIVISTLQKLDTTGEETEWSVIYRDSQGNESVEDNDYYDELVGDLQPGFDEDDFDEDDDEK